VVRALLMNEDQITELAELARADQTLWREFKDREWWSELKRRGEASGQPKAPSMAMIAEEITRRKHGENHQFEIGSLIIKMRYLARQELGLPVC
jgi:hypothetical protein